VIRTMTVDLLCMVKLEGGALLNTWAILSVLPLICLLLYTEPYLNRGKLKYVLWGSIPNPAHSLVWM